MVQSRSEGYRCREGSRNKEGEGGGSRGLVSGIVSQTVNLYCDRRNKHCDIRGFAPTPKALGNAPVSGANATGVAVKIAQVEALEKEEKRRKKAERKEEKRARREARRAERAMTERSESEELRRRRRRDRSRSRSPRDYRIRDKGPHPSRRHSRSRSPRTHSRHYAPSDDSHYGVAEREEVESRDRRYSRK